MANSIENEGVAERLSMAEYVLPKHEQDVALTDPEAFREATQKAHWDFGPYERATIRRLTTRSVSPEQFFSRVEKELQPTRAKLKKQGNDKAFWRSLGTHMLLDEADAVEQADVLIEERDEELVSEFIDSLYPRRFVRARSQANSLLNSPDEALERIRNTYERREAYVLAAQQANIAALDMHAPLLNRLIARVPIWLDRSRLRRAAKQRRVYIAATIQEIKTRHSGLLEGLLESDLDTVILLDLRAKYEKKLAGLTREEAADPAVCLQVYEDVTYRFKQEYIRSHTSARDTVASARESVAPVDDILFRLFELSNAQKNKLVSDMKTYRELQNEQRA